MSEIRVRVVVQQIRHRVVLGVAPGGNAAALIAAHDADLTAHATLFADVAQSLAAHDIDPAAHQDIRDDIGALSTSLSNTSATLTQAIADEETARVAADAALATSIASLDAELDAHVAAADPHPDYQRESQGGATGLALYAAATAAAARTILGLDEYVVLSGDQTEATGSLVNTALTFTPAANAIYIVQAYLVFTTPAVSTGFQWTFGQPTGLTWSTQALRVPISAINSAQRYGAIDANPVLGNAVGTQDIEYLSTGEAMLKSGASPSAVTLQIRTEVAASTVTLRAGSFLRYRRIA